MIHGLSADERICFQRTVDILEATAALLSWSGAGVADAASSSVHRSIVSGTSVVATSCQQLEDLVRLCVDLLLVDGDAKRLLVLLEDGRFLFVLRRFLTVHPRGPTQSNFSNASGSAPTSPTNGKPVPSATATAGGSSSSGEPPLWPISTAAFTPIAFSILQTSLLGVVRDVFVAISAAPAVIALVAPRMAQDDWLEVLMRYLGLQKHQSVVDSTLLEAVYVLTTILIQGYNSSVPLAGCPPSQGGMVVRDNDAATNTPPPPPHNGDDAFSGRKQSHLLVVTDADVLLVLARVEHRYHDVSARNFAMGTLRLWLCGGDTSSSGNHRQGRGPSSHSLTSRSDVAQLREAVASVMAWVLTSDSAAGCVFHAESELEKDGPVDGVGDAQKQFRRTHFRQSDDRGAIPAEPASPLVTSRHRAPPPHVPSHVRFVLLAAVDIITGFIFPDSNYVPHGFFIHSRVDELLVNALLLRRSTLLIHGMDKGVAHGARSQQQQQDVFTSSSSTGSIGDRSTAQVDIFIEILLLSSEAMSRVQSVGPLLLALLMVEIPWPTTTNDDVANLVSIHKSAQSFATALSARWMRFAVQSLLASGRLDEVLDALHDPRVLLHKAGPAAFSDSPRTLWDFIRSDIDSTPSSASSVQELSLAMSALIVSGTRYPTRHIVMKEMCTSAGFFVKVLQHVHSAFLCDGHRGELVVLMYGPDGELLNSVEFVDHLLGVASLSSAATTSRTKDSAAPAVASPASLWQPEALMDVARYILDSERRKPLREQLSTQRQTHNDVAASSSAASLAEKRHKLSTALITWAVLLFIDVR